MSRRVSNQGYVKARKTCPQCGEMGGGILHHCPDDRPSVMSLDSLTALGEATGQEPCRACNGFGRVESVIDWPTLEPCPHCNGTALVPTADPTSEGPKR